MNAFDFSNVNLSVVKTNVRPSADDKPYFRLSETPGRFSLNPLATKMMGLEPGDYIKFYENEDATDMNAWFFIGKSNSEDGENSCKVYSPTGKKEGTGHVLAVSQAGTYSRIVQGERDAREVNAEILEEMGIFVSRQSETHPNRKNFSSLRTVTFEIVEGPVTQDDVQLYALVNPKIKNLTSEDSDAGQDEGEE